MREIEMPELKWRVTEGRFNCDIEGCDKLATKRIIRLRNTIEPRDSQDSIELCDKHYSIAIVVLELKRRGMLEVDAE